MTLYCGNMGLKKGCKYKGILPQKKAFRTWRAGSFFNKYGKILLW